MKNITKLCVAVGVALGGCSGASAGGVIEDIGDFLSFKVLLVYSAASTFYNSDWETWYDYDWDGLKQLMVVNLIKSTVTDGFERTDRRATSKWTGK
ncbi:MAG: hypothetical protein J6Q44_02920 [Alphaproteobacteria bacterium]|nr:hypothetical protein [Alphaproteobacteria bacterium]